MKRSALLCAGGLCVLAVLLVALPVLRGPSVLAMPDDLGSAIARQTPSRLYAAPLRLERGMALGADALQQQLETTRYRPVTGPPTAPGEVRHQGATWTVHVRPFQDADGDEPGGLLAITLSSDGRVRSLARDGRPVRSALLEPAVLWRLHDGDGRDQVPVALETLPAHLVDAVLAIEDQRFFEHHGIDPVRIVGALLANLRSGHVVQGGSTLTQQLVKNRHLSRKRSWLRKLQEIPLALRLEALRSKHQILQAYLNEVYLGQEGGVAVHGVGRASEHWFGKSVTELSLHESALLAGLLRGPSLYSPWKAPEAARARRDQVLQAMLEQGRITPEAYEAARQQPLGVIPRPRLPRAIRYFVDAAAPELRARLSSHAFPDAGLSIYTTLDLRLETLAARAVANGLARLERETPSLARDAEPLQAALVAIEPHSGALRALVGGRDYRASQFDRALLARRQPGSLFKPVVLLAALSPGGDEAPYTLASVLEDEPITLDTPDGRWTPGNHDGAFRGAVTLRQTIEHSLNVPVVHLGVALGLDPIVRAAHRLGITSPLHRVPSLVLGTSEVSLFEMTRAYAVLAAEGWRAEPHDLLAVREADGDWLWRAEPGGTQALDPAEAYVVTSALQGVVARGTGHGVRARGYAGPVAGKTGTTDDDRDAWFIGYTPELVVGVWVGFDDGATLRHGGSSAALPIFTEFLTAALGPRGGRDFRVPSGVETVRVVAARGLPAGIACGGEPEVFLAGTGPDGRCSPWEWLSRHGPFGSGRLRETDAAPDVGSAPPRRRLPAWLRWLENLEAQR